jgi:putative ABC transport system permease protein
VLQDLRFAVRLLARDRWFSILAIAVMALGIGVNAVGFTIVNAALLRGLPFDEADRLFVLTWQGRGGRRPVSYSDFQYWRAQTRTFAGLAAFRNDAMNLSDGRAFPEQVRGTRITADAFTILRQQPLLGRAFASGDDRPGASPVALLSYRVWKNRYGADPAAIGMTVRINGETAVVAGVMPDRMNFPDDTEVWLPLIPTAAQQARNVRAFNVFGRLKDGVSRKEATAELNMLGKQLAGAYPDVYTNVSAVRVETFTERYVGGAGRVVFLVMMGAVTFVLLIACANVANLLMARSADRARELAVRVAVGASRWRIVRQLLIESVLLGGIGGSVGLGLAAAGVRTMAAAIQDPDKPYWFDFSVDHVVLAYVAAICVVTGILFGLAPALHVLTADVNQSLKDGGRGTAGSRRVRRWSAVMVVGELALTVVLLAGGGLMLRSLLVVYRVDVGMSTERIVTMRMQLAEPKYATPDARRAFFARLEERLSAIPGVDASAVTTALPPFASGQRDFEIEGQPSRGPADSPLNVSTVTIGPGFFAAAGAPMRRGRGFDDRDGGAGAESAIVNERMASRFFAGEDPLGRRIRFRAGSASPGQAAAPWLTIVGVSPTIRHGSASLYGEANPVVYVPYRYDPPASAALLVRTSLPPQTIADAVRRGVQAIDPDQPVFTIQTLDQVIAQDRWPFRVFGTMFTIFALIALVLSAAGLFGVVAYSVTQRRQEIGVRMALGANGRQVMWLILKRGLSQLVIGLGIGLAAAAASSQLLRSVLVGISPTDPITFATIAMVLSIVSVAACLIPARRAARVGPLVALRTD